MSAPAEAEIRLLLLCAGFLSLYGLLTVGIAISADQDNLVSLDKVGEPVTIIWLLSLSFVLCAYGVDLLCRRRPARPLATLVEDMRLRVLRPEWMIARATIIAASYALLTFFGPLKTMIGHVRGYPWDQALASADRLLFLGVDPWRVTHALFGSVWATSILHMAYNLWFALMWVGVIYCVLRPEFVALRARYLISFLLTWMIVGSLFAWLLASAGPCFYGRAFGDPAFEPLMNRLHQLDTEARSIFPGLGVHALRVQDMLWNAFTSNGSVFGGGISAAPSMHVALAVLMACAGWKLSRGLGWALSVFAFVIWIGSIHLGWHYAVDGLIALPLTLAIWWFSGWLVDRFVMKEGPAALPQPALAE